jgi:hypothetical protein
LIVSTSQYTTIQCHMFRLRLKPQATMAAMMAREIIIKLVILLPSGHLHAALFSHFSHLPSCGAIITHPMVCLYHAAPCAKALLAPAIIKAFCVCIAAFPVRRALIFRYRCIVRSGVCAHPLPAAAAKLELFIVHNAAASRAAASCSAGRV